VLSGGYSLTQTATGSFSTTETGSDGANDFTLTESGSLTPHTSETGNTVTGAYSRTVTETADYGMIETGDDSLGSYSETVNGSTDTATLVETGNAADGTFTRTITDTGAYSRTDSGPGATLPASDTGSIGYTLIESADGVAGALSASETGTDRYGLLQQFNNVANTGSGNTPGNMDYFPFGQPFVDPGPCGIQIDGGFVRLNVAGDSNGPIIGRVNDNGQVQLYPEYRRGYNGTVSVANLQEAASRAQWSVITPTTINFVASQAIESKRAQASPETSVRGSTAGTLGRASNPNADGHLAGVEAIDTSWSMVRSVGAGLIATGTTSALLQNGQRILRELQQTEAALARARTVANRANLEGVVAGRRRILNAINAELERRNVPRIPYNPMSP
jgi:hypothetical protein